MPVQLEGNQQIDQVSGTAFAPDDQYNYRTPDRLQDGGGTHVDPAAEYGPNFDTIITEPLNGSPAVGHQDPGGASAATGKRSAEASNPPEAKRLKTADTSPLVGLDREVFRLKPDPTVTEIECCAKFFSGILGQPLAVTPEDVFEWCRNYREKEETQPTVEGSPDELLRKAISIKPNPNWEEMQDWADFISIWSGQPFTTDHVIQGLKAYRPSKSPVEVEAGPRPEDGTTASNGRDSGYGTGPPPPPPDATQPRGPELPLPARSNTLPRLPVICPHPECSTKLMNHSGWTRHKTVHWTTKYGCPFCYVKERACGLCRSPLQPLDHPSVAVAEHVITCVRENEDEVGKIIDSNKRGWRRERDHKTLRSHLAEKHPDRASEHFSDEVLETWKVDRPQTHTTCKNCELHFSSAQELDEHYDVKHFGTQRKYNARGGGHDDDTDNNNNDNNDFGPGTSNQNHRSTQQNGKPAGSAHTAHQSPTAGTSYTAGQQRSAGLQEMSSGRDDMHIRDMTSSHEIWLSRLWTTQEVVLSKPTVVYGSLTPPDQQLALDPNLTPQSGTFLQGMGSQFMDQSQGSPSAEADETEEWLHDPRSTTVAPSKVVDLYQRLGKGSTASVGSVWYPNSNEELARKSIRLGEPFLDHSLLAQARREIKTLAMLRHRHITKLVDWYGTSQSMELLMSPVAKDNLMGFMSEAGPPGQRATEPVAREPRMIDQVTRWMSCLSSALAYIHSKGVTHGDIKPQNILISGSQAWLGDFGTAEFDTAYATGPGSTSRWLTPVYSAPEVGNERTRGRPSDIWSFGCLLLEVSTWMAGYRIQSLRDFRGSARSEPYHVNFDSTLSWMRKLRRLFKLQTKLQEKEYILDALRAMLVLKPGARIDGLEAWRMLAGDGCKELGCPCDNESPQVVDERLQQALQALPSGTTQTPEETEIDVIDAMNGFDWRRAGITELPMMDVTEDAMKDTMDDYFAYMKGACGSPRLQSISSLVG